MAIKMHKLIVFLRKLFWKPDPLIVSHDAERVLGVNSVKKSGLGVFGVAKHTTNALLAAKKSEYLLCEVCTYMLTCIPLMKCVKR